MFAFSETDIQRESIKRFFSAVAAERLFVAASTLGALGVGLLTATVGSSTLGSVGLWCGLVAATEGTLTAIDLRFTRRPPSITRFPAWAWAKTALTASHGLAWGLGPILLQHQGSSVSTLAPAWALPIFTAGLIYSCASFLPCIVAATFTGLLPAALWLAWSGSDLDRNVALCLAVSLPASSMIGIFAARNARTAVVAQLEIAALLAKEQEAQRERARFYSAASHDLRQPVHALGLYADLLPATIDPMERREVERRLGECATSLNRQFNAILGVSDADRAEERAHPRIVPLQPLLDAVVVAILPEAKQKALIIRSAPSRLTVFVDADLLERVLLNIAVNAVRYTPAGRVLIGARRSGEMVRICVADTGIGIPLAERDCIFDDFYQADNATRAREKGFGLGLAIVRRLCLAMGWRLTLASSEGRGSAFSVTVPRAVPGNRTGQPDTGLAPNADLPADLVVLIVDDDPLVRDATYRTLSRWGVRVKACAGAAEALAAIARRNPGEDWHALVDYRLADGADGLDLYLRLRSGSSGRIRVTLMSGDITDDIAACAGRHDIVVLNKPIKPIRLRALISNRPSA